MNKLQMMAVFLAPTAHGLRFAKQVKTSIMADLCEKVQASSGKVRAKADAKTVAFLREPSNLQPAETRAG